MRDIRKVFGTVVANDGVNLDIYRGEILSLLGENGSGKTTLMNMLSGIYYPDRGQIYIDGKPVSISSPHEAYKYGIGVRSATPMVLMLILIRKYITCLFHRSRQSRS